MNVTPTHFAIRQLAEDDKPREKLLQNGPAGLSEVELLAILLNSGYREKSALDLAREILLAADNNLGELGRLTIAQLKKIKGVGEVKALSIIAAMELARRRQAGYMREKKTIQGGRDAALYFKPILSDSPFEAFYTLYLNSACRVIRYRCISTGGMSSTVVDPKLIFREALELGASRLLLCHNHPSGSLRPSTADINLTHKLKEAGKLFDIEVLDHIIVSEAGYCSMVEEGIIF